MNKTASEIGSVVLAKLAAPRWLKEMPDELARAVKKIRSRGQVKAVPMKGDASLAELSKKYPEWDRVLKKPGLRRRGKLPDNNRDEIIPMGSRTEKHRNLGKEKLRNYKGDRGIYTGPMPQGGKVDPHRLYAPGKGLQLPYGKGYADPSKGYKGYRGLDHRTRVIQEEAAQAAQKPKGLLARLLGR